MTSIYNIFDPTHRPAGAMPQADAVAAIERATDWASVESQALTATGKLLTAAAQRQGQRLIDDHSARSETLATKMKTLGKVLAEARHGGNLAGSWNEYLRDSRERMILTLDALRQRGDIFLEHEAAGCPPVLAYDYELVMDGADLLHPSNYMLLHILPPEGVTVDERKQPFLIIDPRAGHGPGIGGFKTDSQVGVALRGGHPVYFVAFRRLPEPGQYLSHVTQSEAAFVREVARRHPEAPKPIVIGNCQGGWATLLLAATNPDITGPIVINGAPVATWAGEVGTNPMRYNAGVLGGTWLPMLFSDLGGGLFDGAHLVQNFEFLNPARTMFRKYTDLYRDVDKGTARFLEFERWWGGYFLMTEAEIHWIVEDLFVGNRLVKNEARLEPGRPIDLKAIRAPIIVFASHGDNITPPQQALNWITETYADAEEIRIRGQRIVYMVHEQVGHLGIFVSGSVANKEHSEVATTLETIASLAPGLYEMKIEHFEGDVENRRFVVSLAGRTLKDLRMIDDGLADERPFAAVARTSEIQAQAYEMWLRPWFKAAVTPSLAEAGRALHPLRASRALFASRNPMTAPLAAAAEKVRASRNPAGKDNPFLAAEELWFDMVEQSIDFWRDQRDMAYELIFHSFWGTPWARSFGANHEMRRTLKGREELRVLPDVARAIANIGRGGFAEAVIRILVLLADNRGTVRRDRLERSNRVLITDEPFRSLSNDERAAIIHEQSLISTYEPDQAIATLPLLLKTREERLRAIETAQFVVGAIKEMAPHTLELFQRLREVVEVEPMTGDVTADPLLLENPKPVTVPPEVAESATLPEMASPLSGNSSPGRRKARSAKSTP